MDNKQFLTLFLEDTRENLSELNHMLVQLEKDIGNGELLSEIMRISHSCKGGAATMGFSGTADLFHALEDVFDAARNGTITVSTNIITVCFSALDAAESSLKTIEKDGAESDCSAMTASLRAALKADGGVLKQGPKVQSSTSIASLEATNVQASSVRVSTEKLADMSNIAGEFNLLRQQMMRLKEVTALRSTVMPLLEQMTKLTDDLQFKTMQIRLVSIDQAFARFPRFIRDLSVQQGKNVRLEMTGTDLELDKTLVDHLNAPIIHMLRNAIDHGIESPEERKQAGKAEEALVRILVERAQGYVTVTVEDDGVPIECEKLKAIARTKGFSDADLESITQESILDLLAHPHFSSSTVVTEVSGRGVGLSAVRESAQKMGGQFTLKQENGKKQFILSLPLQLSIVRSLFVESAGDTYVLPFMNIARIVNIPVGEVHTNLGISAIAYEGADVPVVSLHGVFHQEEATQESHWQIVLLNTESGVVGLHVDKVIGNEDVMVKPLAKTMNALPYFSGATILGDGTVALIIDVLSLLRHQKSLLRSS